MDCTAGRVQFVRLLRELGKVIDADDLRAAIFGPWRYRKGINPLGWDPAAVRDGAFTDDAPTNSPPEGVPGALWLAQQALPLFPCFGRSARGYVEGALIWPIWERPISVSNLQWLLGIVPRESPSELLQRGVVAAFRSQRVRDGRYAHFRAPTRVF